MVRDVLRRLGFIEIEFQEEETSGQGTTSHADSEVFFDEAASSSITAQQNLNDDDSGDIQ